jgi:chemosensory pili system protein ChpA (sensor histidine kinase/response regulator)
MDIDYVLVESWLSDPDERPEQESATPAGDGIAAAACRLRPPYQAALVGWYDGQDIPRALNAIDRIFEELEQKSTREGARRLWWVGRGVIEALFEGGLEADDQLKLLFGKMDKFLKAVSQTGDGAHPPTDLFSDLLARLATATAGGERVRDIRTSFDLGELPVRHEQATGNTLPGRHAAKLLHTVAASIKEDLGQFRFFLESLRASSIQPDRLDEQISVLERLSDTLLMLGMQIPRRVVVAQIKLLERVARNRLSPGEPDLIEMTGGVLFIESALDGLISTCADLEEWGERVVDGLGRIGQDQRGTTTAPVSSPIEYQRAIAALIRQATIDLAVARDELLVAAASTVKPVAARMVANRLSDVQAAMAMMQHQKAVAMFGMLVRQIDSSSGASGEKIARLGAILECASRFLATCGEDRADADEWLDTALAGVSALAEESYRSVTEPAPRHPEQAREAG